MTDCRWSQMQTVRGAYCAAMRLPKTRRKLVWVPLSSVLYRLPPKHVMRRWEMGAGSFRERWRG